MSDRPKITIFLPVDYDFPEAEFDVDGRGFSVFNEAGKWVVGLNRGAFDRPLSAVELARGLADALATLEQRRLPDEPPVEQP